MNLPRPHPVQVRLTIESHGLGGMAMALVMISCHLGHSETCLARRRLNPQDGGIFIPPSSLASCSRRAADKKSLTPYSTMVAINASLIASAAAMSRKQHRSGRLLMPDAAYAACYP
jgi:hypothetical protein